MLSGIAYMHHYLFAHRDVKLENFMLVSPARVAPLKLIDFGLARSFETGAKMYSRVGSMGYMAPEVHSKPCRGYDARCDVWSVGVTAYSLAAGQFPLWSDVTEETADLLFPDMLWRDHPNELKKLMSTLLKRDPQQRLHAQMVLESSDWLRQHGRSAVPERAGCCSIF